MTDAHLDAAAAVLNYASRPSVDQKDFEQLDAERDEAEAAYLQALRAT